MRRRECGTCGAHPRACSMRAWCDFLANGGIGVSPGPQSPNYSADVGKPGTVGDPHKTANKTKTDIIYFIRINVTC